jgi:hypothetical protein
MRDVDSHHALIDGLFIMAGTADSASKAEWLPCVNSRSRRSLGWPSQAKLGPRGGCETFSAAMCRGARKCHHGKARVSDNTSPLLDGA